MSNPRVAKAPKKQTESTSGIKIFGLSAGSLARRDEIARPISVVIRGVFGGLGYLMDKYDYSRANFVIAMVLAEMIERNLHITLGLYGNSFIFTRPITLVMFIFIVVTTALPFYRRYRARQRETS